MRSGHSSLVGKSSLLLLEVQLEAESDALVFIIVGDTMYIFGGYNEGNCHNDIYAFDLIRHHWKRIDPEVGILPGKNLLCTIIS